MRDKTLAHDPQNGSLPWMAGQGPQIYPSISGQPQYPPQSFEKENDGHATDKRELLGGEI